MSSEHRGPERSEPCSKNPMSKPLNVLLHRSLGPRKTVTVRSCRAPFAWLPFTTLGATQGQIFSQYPTHANPSRWHLYGSLLNKPSICPWVASRAVCEANVDEHLIESSRMAVKQLSGLSKYSVLLKGLNVNFQPHELTYLFA